MQPRKWSKERFSIITTTMCSMPESPGAGSAGGAAAAARSVLPAASVVAAAVPAAKKRRLERFTSDSLSVMEDGEAGTPPTMGRSPDRKLLVGIFRVHQ